ncbi:uncharacterized protein EV154DRAFT_557446 [Mucor mucedo]|uniref:uncharacterized protein n=1 Tax=Mucor mucedo TaxID=29922 RepID=UPI00221FCE8F|nr:uncharacterized protein EV154DRAFT_557446 [Mucor mucedo]KAI7863100.1 hypothetical protein EV154DRAFT_557446 [Mucor mucedo]
MPFYNYTSINFVNGYNPTTPAPSTEPSTEPSVAPSAGPSAVPSGSANEPFVETTSSSGPVHTNGSVPTAHSFASTGSVTATGSMPSTSSGPSSAGSSEPSSSASSTESNPVDEPSSQLFPEYIVKVGVTRLSQAKLNLTKATEDAFNANGSINGSRDIAAMTTRWKNLCSTFRTKRHLTSRIPTMNPPVWYSSHSGETVDSRDNFPAGRRGRAGVDDDDDQEEEGRRSTQRSRYVNASTWFMACHLEALEDQNREERARDREIANECRAVDVAHMDQNNSHTFIPDNTIQ